VNLLHGERLSSHQVTLILLSHRGRSDGNTSKRPAYRSRLVLSASYSDKQPSFREDCTMATDDPFADLRAQDVTEVLEDVDQYTMEKNRYLYEQCAVNATVVSILRCPVDEISSGSRTRYYSTL